MVTILAGDEPLSHPPTDLEPQHYANRKQELWFRDDRELFELTSTRTYWRR